MSGGGLPPRLVLATGNPGKLREMRAILAPWHVDVRPQSEFTSGAADETGLSFVENAILKARFAAQVAGLPAIADDSGLEVDALGGAPGIRSARYAGPGADDAANNARLLRELEAVPDAARSARYRCAMVYLRDPLDASPGGVPGELGRTHRAPAPWRGRLRLRPAVPGRRGPDDGRRARPGAQEPREPSRAGAAGAGVGARGPVRGRVSLLAPPLALYVHLPWCVRKCPYCDFNSHVVPAAGLPERAYLAALLDDLEFAARDCAGRELVSVFFGGGTPSLFAAESVGRILERAGRLFASAADLEVTLEANPGTVERGRFADYRAAGVNRVSLGAQSFDDERLAALGRIHSSRETLAAVAELHAAGPRQLQSRSHVRAAGADARGRARGSRAGAASRAGAPVALPAHAGARHGVRAPAAAAAGRRGRLRDAGRLRVAPGRGGPAAVRGVGLRDEPGASAGTTSITGTSATTSASVPAPTASSPIRSRGPCVRTARVRQPARYLAAGAPAGRVEESRPVAVDDLAFEFFLNALRLVDGFDAALVRVAHRAVVGIRGRAGGRRRGEGPAAGRATGPLGADPAGTAVPQRPAGLVPAGRAASAAITESRRPCIGWTDRLGAGAVIHTSTAGTQIRHVTSCSRSDMLGDES